MISLKDTNTIQTIFSNYDELPISSYVKKQEIADILQKHISEIFIINIIDGYINTTTVDMTIFLQNRDIVQIVEQYLWEPLLHITKSMKTAIVPIQTFIDESLRICINLMQEPCPLTYRDFSDLAWEKFISNRNYIIALLQDDNSTCICDAEQLYTYFMSAQKFINPLTRQPIKQIYYFITKGRPVFSFLAAVTQQGQSDKYKKIVDTILANSLISSFDVYNARTSLRLNPETSLEECLHLLMLIISDDPKIPYSYNDLTQELQKQGNLISAKAYAKKTVELDETIAYSHAVLGDILQELQEFDDAIMHLQQSLDLLAKKEIEEENDTFIATFAHRILALLFQKLGKFEEATVHFEKFVELNPKSYVSHEFLADHLKKCGQYKKARIHFEQALILNPTSDVSRLALEEITLKIREMKL